MNSPLGTAAGLHGFARRVVVVGSNGDGLVDALTRDTDAQVEGWTAKQGGERFAAGVPTELIVAAVQRCTSDDVVVVVDDREVRVLPVQPSRSPALST